MKKRWCAMLLCLLLVLQITGIPTAATGTVYFTGTEENILPLSDDTQPFWHNNYLYIPASIFTGNTRAYLGVSQTVASDGSWVVLYKNDKAILFKNGSDSGEDTNGKFHYPGAVKKNGQYFVPVSVIASYFDLNYSVKKVSHGWLVWLRSPNFILTEAQFADAAHSVMEQRYQEYVSSKTAKEEEKPPTTTPGSMVITGKKVYLCMAANESTPGLLDVLNRYGAYVTVFCTPEFIAENHDLMRRLVATGHGVGLLLDDGREEIPVLEQARRANQQLAQATGEKTRLVRVENSREETLQQLTENGYCPDISKLKVQGNTLENSTQADNLFRTVSSLPGSSVLWLADKVQLRGLITFLAQANLKKEYCLPLRENTDIH